VSGNQNGATAYPGQVITVYEGGKATAYVIADEAGTLKEFATGSSSTENVLTDAKNYTNEVSAGLQKDYVAKIDAVDNKLSDYVLTANAETASATDKLQTKTTVNSLIDAKIQALDVTAKTATQAQTIKSISETDGKISVELQAI